jgi:probable rRNA maturation factor
MIEVGNETDLPVDTAGLERLAASVLDAMRIDPQSELSIVCIDPDRIAELHVQWLDLPGPTDVLSFPMDELRPGAPGEPRPVGMLGDVVLCPAVAAEQAAAAGHSTEHELRILLTHGILHLLGYDHAEPQEETAMFALQRELVSAFEGGDGHR